MNNNDNFTTDFLFTTPTYLNGASNVFNLAGNFYEYNRSESETEADCKAIKCDFNMIASDLKDAIEKILK